MSHYVCTGGCQGVSETPGTCQVSECADYHKDLKTCDCADGNHAISVGDSSRSSGDGSTLLEVLLVVTLIAILIAIAIVIIDSGAAI